MTRHRETIRLVRVGALALAVLVATPAVAFGPNPEGRLQGAGATCQGGSTPGASCGFEGDCGGFVPCEIVDDPNIRVRALVTIVTDKDAGGPLLFGTPTAEQIVSGTGAGDVVVPVDLGQSALTVLVEFTHQGVDYAFADSFRDVDFPLWVFPAVEGAIEPGGISLGNAPLRGDDLAAAIGAVLGTAPGVLPYVASSRPVALPPSASQSATDQVLGSVLRYKIEIRAAVAAPAP